MIVAGVALIMPASLGLLISGVPTIVCPFPTVTIVPAFLLGRSYGLAVLVPTVLFFLWNPGLFRGQIVFPTRSIVLLAILTGFTGVFFVSSWQDGLHYRGPQFMYAVGALNAVWVLVLWGLLVASVRRVSFARNLLLNWILFAWLAWYAFPYTGELP